MDSQKLNDVKADIKDALTCFICTAKILDPVMCPQCKRLVCSKCIHRWFEENQNNHCPYCQADITYQQMIPLPFMNQLSEFFIKEIDNNKNENKNNSENINRIIDEEEDEDNMNYINSNAQLSKTHYFPNKFKVLENKNYDENNLNSINNSVKFKMDKNKGEMCPKHNDSIIEYYCLNCNTNHCSKCLLFFREESKIHLGHKIIPIEKKNKFNIDEIREKIENLSSVVDKIKEYKDNIDIDNKIIEKKETFVKGVLEEFLQFYSKIFDKKKISLDVKNQSIKNQMERINNIRMSYQESITNFVEREDENGFKEYCQRLNDFKDLEKYKYENDYDINLNPGFKFYETDFMDIDINEYEETIGEIFFQIDGLDKQLHFKLNGEGSDEIYLNLLIELKNPSDDKERFYGLLLLKKDNEINSISLDETMNHDKILILGKTIIKNGLRTIVDNNNKCHMKLVLAHFFV